MPICRSFPWTKTEPPIGAYRAPIGAYRGSPKLPWPSPPVSFDLLRLIIVVRPLGADVAVHRGIRQLGLSLEFGNRGHFVGVQPVVAVVVVFVRCVGLLREFGFACCDCRRTSVGLDVLDDLRWAANHLRGG